MKSNRPSDSGKVTRRSVLAAIPAAMLVPAVPLTAGNTGDPDLVTLQAQFAAETFLAAQHNRDQISRRSRPADLFEGSAAETAVALAECALANAEQTLVAAILAANGKIDAEDIDGSFGAFYDRDASFTHAGHRFDLDGEDGRVSVVQLDRSA